MTKTHTPDAATQTAIASTILQQLGGNKFIAMTGSKNFIAGADEKGCFLRMDLAKNDGKVNRLKITLNSMDTYDLHFYNMRRVGYEFKITNDKHFAGYYDDMLQDAFKKVTGFDTHL